MARIRTLLLTTVALLLVLLYFPVLPTQAEPPSLTNALFLVTDNASHTELAVQPVDRVSLQALGDYAPLSLGHHYTAAISPDRNTMAAVVWPSDRQTGGVLHIIDLTTWNDRVTTATFDHTIKALHFGPEGETLFWVQSTGTAYDPSQVYAVFGCDVRACDSATSWVELPAGLWPFQARLLDSGFQLAIFGIPVDTNYLASDAPQVVVIDLRERQLTASVTVNGFIAGQQVLSSSDDQTPVEYAYNLPGLAWDLDANLLYILYPATPELTVVDLAAGSVARQTDFAGRKVTWYAKLSSGFQHLGIVNERNNHLYFSTIEQQAPSESDEEATAASLPLGIQMVDSETMEKVGEISLPLYEMALSPDGRYLFATGMSHVWTQDSDEVSYAGLYILDAANLETVKHIETNNQTVSLHGFSPDGRYAYVSFHDADADSTGTVMQVIDLTTLNLTANRMLPAGYSALLGTVNTVPW